MAEVRKKDCVFTKFFLTMTMRETTFVNAGTVLLGMTKTSVNNQENGM